MSPPPFGPLAQAWHKWKALRLPWRKRFFVGHDLDGNTYWEFRLARRGTGRWRRIVQCPRSAHYADVRVGPLWHQWLRHTRADAPSLDEQQRDLLRQARVKRLAALADARWDAKPRLLDPDPAPRAAVDAPMPSAEPPAQDARHAVQNAPDADAAGPWAKSPGDRWQPAAWNPSVAKKRP